MGKHEDLRIVGLIINPDESELTLFLEGDNVINTKQFAALTRLMKSGGYTHIRGSAKSGWILSKHDAILRQSEHDAILPQLKEIDDSNSEK